MDNTQLRNFLDQMLGSKTLGVDADGNEVCAQRSEPIMAFLSGYMGELAPIYTNEALRNPEKAKALAAVFEQVAAALRNLHKDK